MLYGKQSLVAKWSWNRYSYLIPFQRKIAIVAAGYRMRIKITECYLLFLKNEYLTFNQCKVRHGWLQYVFIERRRL